MDNWQLMPPWEVNTYFDEPVLTRFDTDPTGLIVARRDPRRVVLGLIGADAGNVVVGLSQGAVNVSNGLVVSINLAPIFLVHQWHSVLCQAEWWARSVAASSVVIVEVCLQRWPLPVGRDPKRVRLYERGDLFNPDRRR